MRTQLEALAQRAGQSEVDTPAELLGFEGAAAKCYFHAFGRLHRSGFVWSGQTARPPMDPLNALLSLTYALLTLEMASLVEAEGLEPALGFLHQMDEGRPSLALDLIEAFRHPMGDRFVLHLLGRDVFSRDDFVTHDSGGTLLAQTAMKRFIEHYERWMLTPRRTLDAEGPPFRDLLRREVRRFLLFLREREKDALFQPYRFKAPEAGEEEPGECDISSVTI